MNSRLTIPRFAHRPLFWFGTFVIWFAVLWLLSSQPGPGDPPITIPHFDKVAHFGYFGLGGGILGIAVLLAFPEIAQRIFIIVVVVSLTICGLIDEWHQLYTPGRSGMSLGDLIADTCGATVAALTLPWLRQKYRYKKKPSP